MATDDITPEDISELAKSPKRITGDEGTVEERSIDELIKADKYQQSQQATKPPYGLRIGRIRFPSTTE